MSKTLPIAAAESLHIEASMVRQPMKVVARTALATYIYRLWQVRSVYPQRLVATWVSLFVLSAFSVLLYVVATPNYFAQLSRLCTSCLDEHLTTVKAQQLHALGISRTDYAIYWTAVNLLFVLMYYAIAVFIFWRKPTNSMAVFAAFALIVVGTSFPDIPNALATAQSSWRLPVAVLDGLGLPSLVTFFFLFPTGRFVPSFTRWIAIGFAVLYIPVTLFPDSASSLPRWSHLLALVIAIAVFGSLIFAQVYRFRRVSTAEERQQTKWVVFGVTLALLGFLLLAFLPLALLQLFLSLPLLTLLPSVFILTGIYLVLLLIPLTIAIAIMRYRLWDIDFIINRLLVYSLLTGSVVGIYVVVVIALGVVIQINGNLLISLAATGLIAVLFQPLRSWLQRGVNRLLYGQRDEPYQVIAQLSTRLKDTLAPDAILSTIVETVAQALKLPYAAILWQEEDAFELAASYGMPVGAPVILPLVYQAETIGQLQLAPRSPGESFTPADLRLLDELTRQAGLAAHAVRLATDLQKAREHLVLTREEERRRLRRDLHDGVGPTLASLSQRIDTACHLIPSDPQAAITLLGSLKTQVKTSIADIRRVVYALRPPVLDELGLVSAIREQSLRPAETGGLNIIVEAPADLPPLPAAVEVAAYRIIMEALSNAEHHAQAHHCLVRLELNDTQLLCLSVGDDGHGLPEQYHVGVGIASMRERTAELGGQFSIARQATGGTLVLVQLPLNS